MGNICKYCVSSVSKKSIQNKEIEEHVKKLEEYEKNTIILQTENELLKAENDLLCDKVNLIELNRNILEIKLRNYKNILTNKEEISKIILDSNLNCKFMDDTLEKKYIESIIEFLYNACEKIKIKHTL